MGSWPAQRVAAAAAVAAAVIWAIKALMIWAAGGLDESPLEAPLFVLGLVAISAAVAALGVAFARGRRPVVKAAAALAGLAAGVGVAIVCDTLADAVLPSSAGWVEEEAGLWLAAAFVVAVSLWWLRRSAPEPGASL
jgi:hypothetical protein